MSQWNLPLLEAAEILLAIIRVSFWAERVHDVRHTWCLCRKARLYQPLHTLALGILLSLQRGMPSQPIPFQP